VTRFCFFTSHLAAIGSVAWSEPLIVHTVQCDGSFQFADHASVVPVRGAEEAKKNIM
jgi:hypothetical protein